MNSSTKVAIHRSVKFAICCIAAASTITQRNYRFTDAFVIPQPILTPKQTLTTSPTTSFFPNQHHHHQTQSRHPYITTPIMATTTSSDEELYNEINSMKAKDIRQELQSYGISTKSFFEKSELVDALVTARKEGKTPVMEEDGASSSSATASSTTTNASSETTTSASTSSGDNRQERLNEEMEKCKSMKVGELKKELESYGVSTKSFFEKSEFVRAVAEIRVDGVKQTSTTAGGSSTSSRVNEEPRDPSFRDVTVTKFKDKALLGRGVIDVRAR